ncbi:MAG: hypothetical protein ACP5F1_02015 [Thermoplasmata archaeon]|nr:hypothetical protein [Thermoplasmata archaeon]
MEKTSNKKKKLDMSKNNEFRYLLKELVEDLPENLRGSVFGAIYSKASKIGTYEARNYILKIKEDGLIDEKKAKELIDLVFKYSKYY